MKCILRYLNHTQNHGHYFLFVLYSLYQHSQILTGLSVPIAKNLPVTIISFLELTYSHEALKNNQPLLDLLLNSSTKLLQTPLVNFSSYNISLVRWAFLYLLLLCSVIILMPPIYFLIPFFTLGPNMWNLIITLFGSGLLQNHFKFLTFLAKNNLLTLWRSPCHQHGLLLFTPISQFLWCWLDC